MLKQGVGPTLTSNLKSSELLVRDVNNDIDPFLNALEGSTETCRCVSQVFNLKAVSFSFDPCLLLADMVADMFGSLILFTLRGDARKRVP